MAMNKSEKIKYVVPGVWSSDLKSYPDTAEHRKLHPEFYTFEHLGYRCEVARSLLTLCWCGYVTVPTSHPYYGRDYDELDILIYGGITYSHEGTLGFDCSHYTDIIPPIMIDGLDFTPSICKVSTYKNYDFVIDETMNLARMLKEAENNISLKIHSPVI